MANIKHLYFGVIATHNHCQLKTPCDSHKQQQLA